MMLHFVRFLSVLMDHHKWLLMFITISCWTMWSQKLVDSATVVMVRCCALWVTFVSFLQDRWTTQWLLMFITMSCQMGTKNLLLCNCPDDSASCSAHFAPHSAISVTTPHCVLQCENVVVHFCSLGTHGFVWNVWFVALTKNMLPDLQTCFCFVLFQMPMIGFERLLSPLPIFSRVMLVKKRMRKSVSCGACSLTEQILRVRTQISCWHESSELAHEPPWSAKTNSDERFSNSSKSHVKCLSALFCAPSLFCQSFLHLSLQLLFCISAWWTWHSEWSAQWSHWNQPKKWRHFSFRAGVQQLRMSLSSEHSGRSQLQHFCQDQIVVSWKII